MRRFATLILVIAVALSGCTMVEPAPVEVGEIAVPVTAVLDPTSALYTLDQLVVIGYLKCFDDLSRLYATYDEAQRASLLNAITIVKPDGANACPAEGETELGHCSYRGKMTLQDNYSNPRLIVDEFLHCTDFGDG